MAGEGVISGDNNQEEIWFSQHSLLYSFPASIYCSFPGKNKGFKKTLKRVMKFLRVLSTNLLWNVGGTWEKTQRCLGSGKLKMEGALLTQHGTGWNPSIQEGWYVKGWWDADGLVWFWGWGKFPMDKVYQGEGNHLSPVFEMCGSRKSFYLLRLNKKCAVCAQM